MIYFIAAAVVLVIIVVLLRKYGGDMDTRPGRDGAREVDGADTTVAPLVDPVDDAPAGRDA